MNNNLKVIISLVLMFAVIFSGCSSQGENISDNAVELKKEEADKSDAQLQQEKLGYVIIDGVYNEQIDYKTPAGEEMFELNLEIENQVITLIQIEIDEKKYHETSVKKTNQVNEKLQELVLGKDISEIEIPIVSGASLTSKALRSKFEEIAQI